MNCVRCGAEIAKERFEALGTYECVRCSTVQAKTSKDVEVDAADPNELRNAVSNQENY